MRFYAERPLRLVLQISCDVLVILWVVGCVLVARASQRVVLQLQEPGLSLARAGSSMQTGFDTAAQTAAGVPLIGDDMAQALRSGSEAGASLVTTGQGQAETITTMAAGTAASVVLVGALPVVLLWLAFRIRYARRARSALLIRQRGTDLLALRALAHLPAATLLATSPDPAAAWRFGDPATLHRLAELELRSLGLWAPPVPPA
jgi:hypothetical protein